MHKKTLIPYSIGDYNQILEDFQIEKIRSMKKDELLDHLKNLESWIYDCYLKKQCINLFQKTGGFLAIGLLDDDLYKIGVETTIMQLNKRYFFDLNSDCHLLILNKVKSRIVNNIRNFFSPLRKTNYLNINQYFFSIEEDYEPFKKIVDDIYLKNIGKETLKYSLRKVWEDAIGDMDFDIKDFEELCTKFDFTPLDVLIYDPYVLPQMSKVATNNSNYQLVLAFDHEKVA